MRHTARQKMLALALCVAAAACGVMGCSSTGAARVRAEQARAFSTKIEAKTKAALPDSRVVGLEDCVRIALANNMDVESAEIQRRIAALDRKIAFGDFLPKVDLQVTRRGTSKVQAIKTGPAFFPLSDQRITDITLSAQQPIFVPQAWLMYAAMKKKEDIAKLVAVRTKQLITLQVSTLYFACLSLDETRAYLESAVAQTETFLAETEARAGDGLGVRVDIERAKTLLLARQNALKDNARILRQTKGELLEAMGLSPFGEIKLRRDAPLADVELDLADQVMAALLSRPELRIADRVVQLRRGQAKLAIAEFLPQIVGFGALNHTSDSFVKYANLWSYGVGGVLSVFNGFKSVHAYRQAREHHKDAFVRREQMCLAIMLQVLSARLQVDRTADGLRLARQQCIAAEAAVAQLDEQWREGLITPAARLAGLAGRDEARTQLAVVEFQHQVALAALLDVIGKLRTQL